MHRTRGALMSRRRTKGDGGITLRADGRWQGTYDIWVGGAKKRRYVYAKTKKGAQIKLRQLVREYEAGTLVLTPVSYTHLRAHETPEHLVCRLLLEKKK